MSRPNFFERLKQSLSAISHGDKTIGEKTIEKQFREAQLLEIQNALLVLCAEVLKAGKSFPKHTENLIINYFNQHFGFIHSQKRMHNLRQYLTIGSSPYVKISCTQIKNLSTSDSIEEILGFLFEVAASSHFIGTAELRVLKQIQGYLGVNEEVFLSLKKKTIDSSNPYVLLGVETSASLREIQSAYRKKVLLYHPDKCRLPMSAEEKNRHFEAIQAAYESCKEKAESDKS